MASPRLEDPMGFHLNITVGTSPELYNSINGGSRSEGQFRVLFQSTQHNCVTSSDLADKIMLNKTSLFIHTRS
jgi:hypothetical protein